MQVPLYDHAARYQANKADIDTAVARVLERGALDWGPEVPAFEAEFAAWLGVAHVVGCNSGTAALTIALSAIGIGPGDEVITAPNSDIGTAAAIHASGARIVFVDVEPDTLNLDPALVEAAIGPKTKALLPVDLFGHPADLPALVEIARRHGLALVEDACLALGASIGDRAIGQFADITCFSHAPTKHLGAAGSAGSAATADVELAARMQRLAGYGQDRARHQTTALATPAQDFRDIGLNQRLDELQAAILRAKLPHLTKDLAHRRDAARLYDRGLAGLGFGLPIERPRTTHSYRNYVIRVENREQVRGELADAGVATALPYVPPLHLQPALAHLGYQLRDFPVTEKAAEEILALPLGAHLDNVHYAHVVITLARV